MQDISAKEFNIKLIGVHEPGARSNLLLRATTAHELTRWMTALRNITPCTFVSDKYKAMTSSSDSVALVREKDDAFALASRFDSY